MVRYFQNTFEEYVDGGDMLQTRRSSARGACLNRLRRILSVLHRDEEHLLSSRYATNYLGTSGIAYLFVRLYLTLKNADDTQKAREIRTLVCEALKLKDGQFSSLLELALKFSTHATRLKKGKGGVTLLEGEVGVHAVRAVIWHLLGNESKSRKCCDLITNPNGRSLRAELSQAPFEVLYGKGGYLCAMLFLDKYLGTSYSKSPQVLDLCREVVRLGREPGHSHLMYQWHGQRHLGGAHGISGIASTLLQFPELLEESPAQSESSSSASECKSSGSSTSSDPSPRTLIENSVDFVYGTRASNENYPSSVESARYMEPNTVHWCRGAPAASMVFLRAHLALKKESYLQRAIEASNFIWKYGLLRRGVGLCHGVTGNAYAFLELYKVTGDDHFLYKAMCFAEFAANVADTDELERMPDRPYSLFEGMSGEAVFYIELLCNPTQARFPMVNFS